MLDEPWIELQGRFVARFSSDGDGGGFPEQRWGFWALVSEKPAHVQVPFWCVNGATKGPNMSKRPLKAPKATVSGGLSAQVEKADTFTIHVEKKVVARYENLSRVEIAQGSLLGISTQEVAGACRISSVEPGELVSKGCKRILIHLNSLLKVTI